MPLRKLILAIASLGFLTLVTTFADQPATTSVPDLITRFAPDHAENFEIEQIPAIDGKDAYEIESKNGKIILRGSSGVAQASAFYHFLKDFCHAHISWNGDNLTLPATLPTVPEKIRVVSPVKHRLAYNYCTHGYTMPFWGKEEWAREIDWLALHGINRALIIQGQEAVWQSTFTQFGYTKEEMRQWISSPAHVPWQFMGNLDSFLAPSQAVIDQRAELGRFIVERCRSLGIEPVLQGYYGLLPSGFAEKHEKATIVPQGEWVAGFHQPDMLDPADPLFAPIAKAFMKAQHEIYGGEILYYAADPFHEGGQQGHMNRGTVYRQIQDAILAFEPKATLVKQCWQASNKEMFDAGNKEKSLALDLWCDVSPFWQKANGYDGTPWAWSLLYNFGGNTALEADLPRLSKDFGAALTDPGRGRLEAIAIVPEGSQTNPMVYELMTEMSWRGAPENLDQWIKTYLHARYGSSNPAAEEAWETILETAYSSPQGEGSGNSVITARPTLNKNLQGRTWAPRSRVTYDAIDLTPAWEQLLAAAPQLSDKDTYRYDLASLTRQVLLNLARPIYEKAVDAIQTGDQKALALESARFLALLTDLETLTATRSDWLTGKWVADTEKWGKTTTDHAQLARTARMLITTWVENPETDLADYANREWNGLIGEFYLPRWKLFFESASADLKAGKSFDHDAFRVKRIELDAAWVNATKNTMLTTPKGDTVEISKQLLAKYSPHFSTYFGPRRLPITKQDVIGTWKYQAEGSQYLRELRPDGTVQAYQADGTKLDWFNNFSWTIENDRVVLERDGHIITLIRHTPDTLTFISEGFGEAVKAKTP